ncbi:TetR family transcriptional regulator [Rhodococcus spelaei]|uniref:TetR family transcriptional regulator n=1 Tax=Rhodococcus spelaei TaxID=2546320 RepID=A0A541B1V7_9NOCA|nr:TetR family transcriptional regulator [Rhodococcus spelaei]TQF66291.1 TetR family transcriptional regulator [Rhodococcus spelaei]
MAPRPEQLGLRERKKLRTRAAIRTEAMRLFETQGYEATTIEQIAEAAEVSPSTFFRYFPSKERVVMADDLDDPTIAALERIPLEVPPLAAFRQAFETTLAGMSEEQVELELARSRLMFRVPALRAAFADELYRSIEFAVEILARRLDRDPDDPGLRVLVGAMTGAVLAMAGTAPEDLRYPIRALELLEAGLPVG